MLLRLVTHELYLYEYTKLYTENKSCGTKPKKGFVHATKPLKGLLVCNETETLF